jgi:hypothetical protein
LAAVAIASLVRLVWPTAPSNVQLRYGTWWRSFLLWCRRSDRSPWAFRDDSELTQYAYSLLARERVFQVGLDAGIHIPTIELNQIEFNSHWRLLPAFPFFGSPNTKNVVAPRRRIQK